MREGERMRESKGGGGRARKKENRGRKLGAEGGRKRGLE